MIHLSRNTAFSPLLSKGTLQARSNFVEQVNDKVFNEVLSLYKKKDVCAVEAMQSRYNSALPEKKNVKIVSLPKKDCDDYAGGMFVDVYKDCVRGYAIQLPVEKNKKVNISILPNFMHESTHVLDYLLNPKYVRNYKKMCEKNIFDKKYFQIFPKLFDNPAEMVSKPSGEMLEKAKTQTTEELRHVPFNQKIVFLNFIKYALELEQHAYNQSLKFEKLMKKAGKLTAQESFDGFTDVMKYKEKHQIVKDIIQDEIIKERKKLNLA